MKEALKTPDMVNRLVQAFWKKQISVGLANKVLCIITSMLFSFCKFTKGLVVLELKSISILDIIILSI